MTAVAYQDGQWCCYSLPDGRHKHFLGCSHERPRQAIAHVTPIYVSPLRSESGDGPTRLVPLHGTELGPSPDVEGRSNR